MHRSTASLSIKSRDAVGCLWAHRRHSASFSERTAEGTSGRCGLLAASLFVKEKGHSVVLHSAYSYRALFFPSVFLRTGTAAL